MVVETGRGSFQVDGGRGGFKVDSKLGDEPHFPAANAAITASVRRPCRKTAGIAAPLLF